MTLRAKGSESSISRPTPGGEDFEPSQTGKEAPNARTKERQPAVLTALIIGMIAENEADLTKDIRVDTIATGIDSGRIKEAVTTVTHNAHFPLEIDKFQEMRALNVERGAISPGTAKPH